MNRNMIRQTFEAQMKQAAITVQPFDHVTNNHVFKIETAARPYIFKVYSSNDWPENGKLPFVCRKLAECRIPHAELFVFDRSNENFPGGYLIEECLPGTTADRLTLSQAETLKLFEQLAVLVSCVHQIKMNGYGYTGDGSPAGWTTVSEHLADVLQDNIPCLAEAGVMPAAELDVVYHALQERLKVCDTYPPVLCHGDLSAKNMLVHAGDITLIDWDDTHSLCWMADIARLTLWMKMHYDAKTAEGYRAAFLGHYTTAYDKNAFEEAEDILHVWYALDNLTFFKGSPIAEKVKRLLNEARGRCGL